MEGSVELHIGNGLLRIDDVNLRDWTRGLILQNKMTRTREGAALRKDVDRCVDCDDLRLRQVFVFFEVPLVVCLDVTASLCIQILIEHVGVVKVPTSARDGEEQKERARGNQSRRAAPSQP